MRFDLLIDGKTYDVELGIGRVVTARLDGETFQAEVEKTKKGLNIRINGKRSFVQLTGSYISIDGHKHQVEVRNLRRGRPSWYYAMEEAEDVAIKKPVDRIIKGEGMLYPPMPGRVVSIKVKEGDPVRMGSPILVLEAMKMQNELCSKWDGVVREVRVSEGDLVELKDVLMVIGE